MARFLFLALLFMLVLGGCTSTTTAPQLPTSNVYLAISFGEAIHDQPVMPWGRCCFILSDGRPVSFSRDRVPFTIRMAGGDARTGYVYDSWMFCTSDYFNPSVQEVVGIYIDGLWVRPTEQAAMLAAFVGTTQQCDYLCAAQDYLRHHLDIYEPVTGYGNTNVLVIDRLPRPPSADDQILAAALKTDFLCLS